MRLDPAERLWRIDRLGFVAEVGVPGLYATREMAAAVLDARLRRGRLDDAARAAVVLAHRAGRPDGSVRVELGRGSVALRAAV